MELVYGQTVKIPGDLTGGTLRPDSDLPTLLHNIRKKTFRPPIQTAHHDRPYVNLPTEMDTATHVYVKVGKHTPLGANFDGPYPILERIGQSCLKVRQGYYVNGTPREEIVHWKNCKVGHFTDEPPPAARPTLGRPKKST